MNIKKLQKNVVLICDRVNDRNNINILSDNLEFTSNTYFNAMSTALEQISKKVYYYETLDSFINNIKVHKDDIVISAIWSGTKSRNRKALVASICEAYGIVYLGADAYVQSVCQDKLLCKSLLDNSIIKVPKGVLFEQNSCNYDLLNFLQYPLIIKPNLEGSSIGISDESISDNKEQAIININKIINNFSPVLAEEYIPGQEISICCAGCEKIELIEAVELEIDNENYFDHRIWGYESKKGGKCKVSRKVVTNDISPEILKAAENLFLSLGKVDYMRIDGRLYNNNFYLIELTPDCSLHPNCFMYEAFKHNGYSYTEMICGLLNLII